jgi:hypothetical protein
MEKNNLYRINIDEKKLIKTKEVEFSSIGVKERYDIQEWVEGYPQILGEELLIIGKELSFFSDTRERPDLIAIDKAGNVVVIELKRDDSGSNLEWQAIKYASYLSKFSKDEVLTYFAKYRNNTDEEYTSLENEIADFVEDGSLEDLNKRQRIILVSHRFAKEVTSAVYWLIDKYKLDIKCVQVTPYHDAERGSYYLQSTTILPVAGVENLLIGAAERTSTSLTGSIKKDDEITSECEKLFSKLGTKIDYDLMPTKRSRGAGVLNSETRYFHLWYTGNYWDNWNMSYKLWFNPDLKTGKIQSVELIFSYLEQTLLINGINELKIEKISKVLQTYLEGNNYRVYKKIKAKGIKKSFRFDMDVVLDELVKLIKHTKPAIQAILDE